MDKGDILAYTLLVVFGCLAFFFVKTLMGAVELYIMVEEYLRKTGNDIGLKALEVTKDLALTLVLAKVFTWIGDALDSLWREKKQEGGNHG